MSNTEVLLYLIARHCGDVQLMHAIRWSCSYVYRRTSELVDVYLEKRVRPHVTEYFLGNQLHNHHGRPAAILTRTGKQWWVTYGQKIKKKKKE